MGSRDMMAPQRQDVVALRLDMRLVSTNRRARKLDVAPRRARSARRSRRGGPEHRGVFTTDLRQASFTEACSFARRTSKGDRLMTSVETSASIRVSVHYY